MATDAEDRPWWMLDMQREVDVAMVRISNRVYYYNRLSNFEIRIGMNPHDLSQNGLCFNMSDVAPRGETVNFLCLNAIRGRYLSIQLYPPYANGAKVQFCEVQVIPELSDLNRFNIAPYGKAYQSSTTSYTDATNFGPASRAIDGFPNPDWDSGYSCSLTDPNTTDNWWMLDFQQPVTVTLVRITNRSDYTHTRLYNFEIRVGFNDTDFSQNALCYYMPGIMGDGATEDFPCLTSTRGRYLTIQRVYPWGPSGSTILTLCEVQVFQTGC